VPLQLPRPRLKPLARNRALKPRRDRGPRHAAPRPQTPLPRAPGARAVLGQLAACSPARPVLRTVASAARRARGVVRSQACGRGARSRGARPAARLAAGVPMPWHDVRAARARPVPRRNSRPMRPHRRGLRGGRQCSPGMAACVPTRRAPSATACATLRSMSRRIGNRRRAGRRAPINIIAPKACMRRTCLTRPR
jgi:hypothetical protein